MPDHDPETAEATSDEPEERDTHTGARLVSVSVAAKRCDVSRRSVDRWVSSGKLQDYGDQQKGRRVRLEEVLRLAEESRRQAGRGPSQSEGQAEVSRGEVADLRRQLDAMTKDRDAWRAQAEYLVRALPPASPPVPEAPTSADPAATQAEAVAHQLEGARSRPPERRRGWLAQLMGRGDGR